MDFDRALQDCIASSLQPLALSESPDDLESWAGLFCVRAGRGASTRKPIARLLFLQDPELDMLLRELGRLSSIELAGQSLDRDILWRNHRLTVLRALSWFETAIANKAQIASPALGQAGSDHVDVFKSLRALELLMRDLLREQHPDTESISNRLKELFPSSYREALRRGEGDALAGVYLKDLIAFFVDPAEWQRVGRLFEPSRFLSLLRDKRDTAESFLEDVRRVRNSVAHLKRLSAVQVELLNLYYDELVTPVRSAFHGGTTKVDPGSYEQVSSEELQRYIANIGREIAVDSRRTLTVAIAALITVLAIGAVTLATLAPKLRLRISPDLAYEDAYSHEHEALGLLAVQACESQRISALASLAKKPEAADAFLGGESSALHALVMELAANKPHLLTPCVRTLHSMGWDINRVSSNEARSYFGDASAARLPAYRTYLKFYSTEGPNSLRVDPSRIRITPLQCAVWNRSTELARALVESGADPAASAVLDGIWSGASEDKPVFTVRSEALRIGDGEMVEILK